MEKLKSKDEFYQAQSKEQLIIFLNNKDYIENQLRTKLQFITGCSDFGNSDGTNGSCVECSYNNPKLFNRCVKFREEYRDFLQSKTGSRSKATKSKR